MDNIIGYILTGGVAAASVKLLDNIIQWLLNRKAARRDSAAKEMRKTEEEKEKELDDVKDTVRDLAQGQVAILHDRLKYLGRSYIRARQLDLNDREDLIKMHEAYHKLGGNGNLNALMAEILELPLRHD